VLGSAIVGLQGATTSVAVEPRSLCVSACRDFRGAARGRCQRTCAECQHSGAHFCAGNETMDCCADCEICAEMGECFDRCSPTSCLQCDPVAGVCVSYCGACQRCGEEFICVPCGAGPSPGCCLPSGSCLVCAPGEQPLCDVDPPECRPFPIG
jgi:hypothetical protein